MPLEWGGKKLFKQELNPVNLQALQLAVLPCHNLTVAGFSDLLLKPQEVLSDVELGSLLNLLLNRLIRLMESLVKKNLLKRPFERDWFGLGQIFFFNQYSAKLQYAPSRDKTRVVWLSLPWILGITFTLSLLLFLSLPLPTKGLKSNLSLNSTEQTKCFK